MLPFQFFCPLTFWGSHYEYRITEKRKKTQHTTHNLCERPKLVRVQIQILVSEREKKKDGESYQLDDDDHDEQQESSDEICQSLLLAVSVAVSRL